MHQIDFFKKKKKKSDTPHMFYGINEPQHYFKKLLVLRMLNLKKSYKKSSYENFYMNWVEGEFLNEMEGRE